MKILVLNIEYPPLGGGAAPVGKAIAEKLMQDFHHDVTILTMAYSGLSQSESINGVEVIRVPGWRKKQATSNPIEHIVFLISVVLKLEQICRRKQFDICHIHFLIPTGILGLWLRWRWNLPFIVTSHGSDVPGFNTDRFTLIHRLTPPIIRRVVAAAQQVTVPSHYLAELIEKNIGQRAVSKLIYIPNGVEVPLSQPKNKKNIILASGRFVPRKGFQFIIEALSTLNLGFELHICGDGPMRAELETVAKNSKTPITFHGWVDRDGVTYKKLLESAAIFCSPSQKENASIALLEGMSAGCAVISGNDAGSRETIGDAGISVPWGDVKQLRSELETLQQDKALRELLQRKAYVRAQKYFSWDTIVQQYNQVLEMNAR